MIRGIFRGREARALGQWVRLRAGESSTWSGLAMIAVVLGSEPLAANGVAQAISLIVGGGLVTAGPTPGPTPGSTLGPTPGRAE